MKTHFKPTGKKDYAGFQWFKAYNENGLPIMEQGVHVKYKALDINHAYAMHKQLTEIRERV